MPTLGEPLERRTRPILDRSGYLVASLYLAVADERHQPLQGNVFVSLTHDASATTWRTLLWNRSTQSFLFPDLPLGAFSYRVWTSVDHYTTGRVVLEVAGPHHASAMLPTRTPTPRLELPIHDRLTRWRARLASPAPLRAGLVPLQHHLPTDEAGQILADLLSDPVVVASVTRPLGALGLTPELWHCIEIHTRSPRTSAIVTARARFLVITHGVVNSPAIRRRLAPAATNQQVWAALLRVMATLDDADLDEVFLWAARLQHPEAARVEEFGRVWAERFNGVNNLRVPIARGRANDAVPSADVRELVCPAVENIDPMLAYISAPVLADIAHIVCALCRAR
jgi:hypothetical protein